ESDSREYCPTHLRGHGEARFSGRLGRPLGDAQVLCDVSGEIKKSGQLAMSHPDLRPPLGLHCHSPRSVVQQGDKTDYRPPPPRTLAIFAGYRNCACAHVHSVLCTPYLETADVADNADVSQRAETSNRRE